MSIVLRSHAGPNTCSAVATAAAIVAFGCVTLAGCSSTPTDGYVSPDEAFRSSGSSTRSLIGPAYSIDSGNSSFGGMYDTRVVSADQLVRAQQQQMAQTRQQALAAQQEMMRWGRPQTASERDADNAAYTAWKSQNGF